MKPRAALLSVHDLVLPGAAGHIPYLVGAYRAIERFGLAAMRVSGTSSGSIVACGIASGLTAREMVDLGVYLLGGNRLLRRRVIGTMREPYGLHSTEPLRAAIAENFAGPMHDTYIPWGAWVVDLETQSPRWLSSVHPSYAHLSRADVVTASCALYPVFTTCRIPTIKGRFVDGGFIVNVGADVFDDEPGRPTLVVRLEGQGQGRERTALSHPIEVALAAVGSLVDAASRTHVSRKQWPTTVTIPTKGSSLDFNQSPTTVRAKEVAAYETVSRWLEEPVEEVIS